MAKEKITPLRPGHENSPARELSPSATVQQALYQRALNLLALPRLEMREAITELDLDVTRKALVLEQRSLRRRDVLALLAQQELLQVIGDSGRAVILARHVHDSITNALLLARENARYPLEGTHRVAMVREIDTALACLGEVSHG
ncbi:hypothetical protein [Alloalcanivorax xenomutans]|uniref:hypothetical protein n=1 Tax=Alloalcanivorax xenomutans TaxID=1094342 RepID=UPI003BAB5937